PELRGMVEDMKMTYAPDIPSALALARSWGKESLAVIPDGVSVIPRA
ncbi:MAG TPA: lactate racemization operon protein LarA, partial [Candidatus Scatomorpha intestinigallinarum]|nr:lactate racemization operon protein LarA [Candidatus Scatomorpha intestinigallinarum]